MATISHRSDAIVKIVSLSDFIINKDEDMSAMSWSVYLQPNPTARDGIEDSMRGCECLCDDGYDSNEILIEYTALKNYIHRELQPSDSSRGMNVLPTVFIVQTAQNSSNDVNLSNDIFTSDGGLIITPFPDLTMPFNVISMVSKLSINAPISYYDDLIPFLQVTAVMVFLLGSMINSITRQSQKANC